MWILYISSVFFLFECCLSEKTNNGHLKFVQVLDGVNTEKTSWLCSPVSVRSVLEEVYLGTKGVTKTELASFLNVKNDANIAKEQNSLSASPGDGVKWKMANRVLVKKTFPLSSTFREKISSIFHSDIENSNFDEKAVESVNSWVSNQTDGLIREVVSPGDFGPSSLLVLLNAVYFQGSWKYAFPEEDTEPECFYRQPGKCTQTQMMKLRNQFKFTVHQQLDAKIIQLPYSDARYTMVVVLPNKYDGLTDVVKKLTSVHLTELLNKLSFEHLHLYMPKFTTKFKIKLNEPLKKLGIQSIFGSSADFSGMTDSKGLFVSDVFHEARISVSEKGTVAAASTGMVFGRTLVVDEPEYVDFKIDRPFLYFVTLNNTEILFAGQYYN